MRTLRTIVLFVASCVFAVGTVSFAYAAEEDSEGTLPAEEQSIEMLAQSSQLYSVDLTQATNSTKVTVDVPNAKNILNAFRADTVTVTATMNYGDVITREVSAEKSIASLSGDDSTFEIDFKDYGKFTVSIEFSKGGTVVRTDTQTFGVVADEYNIAPVSASLPATFFSLALFESGNGSTPEGDIRHDANGNIIPTILMMERPGSYDWEHLPEGVYPLPYLTVEEATTQPSDFGAASDKFRKNAPAVQAYVADLYEMNPNSTFHLYLVDFYLGLIQTCLYANGIPESNYTITVMSDGSFSYRQFGAQYDGMSLAENENKETALEGEWKTEKAYAYANGKVQDGVELWSNAALYAVLQCETNIEWWGARPALMTSPNDNNAFGALAAANSKVVRVRIDKKLKLLTEDEQAEFKALFNCNDSYFSEAEESGKKVMLFLGTTVGSEAGSFPDYARFVQTLYGDEDYAYYYKGHPGSSTDMYPSKQAELEELGITDVDSSVPAELIIFFNPGIYLAGYTSSTYASVDNGKNVLFRESKAAAQTDANNVKDMQYFVTPITDSSEQALKDLKTAGKGSYLVEVSDAILASADYDIALWNPDTLTINYYKKTGDAYTFVRSSSTWNRLAGDTALDTMTQVVDTGFADTNGTVVIAQSGEFWDALTAAGIAGLGASKAPVLLTDGQELSSQTASELERLKPSKVIVCGGESAISAAVLQEIEKATGVVPTRCQGKTATSTARDIVNQGTSITGGTWSDTAFIATNESCYDSLSIAPYAYAHQCPIFLSEGSEQLSQETLDTMKSNGITKVYIVGGTTAVSTNVEAQLSKAEIKYQGRLWGENAIDTCGQVVDFEKKAGMTANNMGVATSNDYYDALTGAALCGKNNAVMILANDDNTTLIDGFVNDNKADIANGYVFGGASAISDNVFRKLVEATG